MYLMSLLDGVLAHSSGWTTNIQANVWSRGVEPRGPNQTPKASPGDTKLAKETISGDVAS